MRKHRLIGILAAAILATAFAEAAPAQTTTGTRVTNCNAATPNNALCIEWTHDGKDTNGNPVSGITFRVEQQAGSSSAWTQLASGLTVKKYYATGLTPGTYLFRVVVSAPGVLDSDPSNPKSGTATAPPAQLSTPVIIIAATIRVGQPPVYRIVQSINLRPNEVVMVAPASMRPAFQ